MSIKIIAQEKLELQNNKMSIIPKLALIYLPTPKTLYANRVKRMISLSPQSSFADYLNFCTKIVAAQASLLEKQPITLPEDIANIIELQQGHDSALLSLNNLSLSAKWIDYLHPIMDAVFDISAEVNQTINGLKNCSNDELLTKANYLLTGQFHLVDSNQSLFIWSALSLYYCQLASLLPIKAIGEFGEQRWLCPVCQSSPVASIIHTGDNLGLRYLHCSLCETQWYVPRAKCTNCDNLKDIVYYSLDDELSAIKTECCESCHSYLKIFNQAKDSNIDIIADDIDSLLLDVETENEKFAKSGLNPLLFSTE